MSGGESSGLHHTKSGPASGQDGATAVRADLATAPWLSFILGESRHGLAIIQRGMLGAFVADCVHAGSVLLYR
jgi:hypothetical protein